MLAMTVILTGCSSRETAKIKNISDLKGKFIGMTTSANSPEMIMSSYTKAIGAAPKEVVYFNNTSDAVTAVMTGKVDAVYVLKFCGDYYLKKNSDLNVVEFKLNSEAGIMMAVRSEDQQLKADLDKAITTLKENGTLKALEEKWITNLPTDNEATNNEIQKNAEAKTVYVGVSGDFVPLDYIAADGRPAGYNVALLNEVGKLINVNFEFVSIENQARFAALSSKKIDVIFTQFEANTAWVDEVKNDKWIGTKPYYSINGQGFLVKK